MVSFFSHMFNFIIVVLQFFVAQSAKERDEGLGLKFRNPCVSSRGDGISQLLMPLIDFEGKPNSSSRVNPLTPFT